MEAYNELYLNNVIELHRLVFLILSEDDQYSFFSLVDEYMRNSEIRAKMDVGNWSALNKGHIQVLNSIPKENCKEKPIDELVDPIAAKWIGTVYTYMQWKYNISSKEISLKIDSHELFRLYNPLHEVSIQKAAEKLYIRFKHRQE